MLRIDKQIWANKNIRKFEDKSNENIQSGWQRKINEVKWTDLGDTIKHVNICKMGAPEGEWRKKSIKIFEKIIALNFPNLMEKY